MLCKRYAVFYNPLPAQKLSSRTNSQRRVTFEPQRDLTGDVMDEILRATGCTQRELESVLAKRFTPLQMGQFGIPNVWTVPGAAARKKTRDSPFP